VLKEAGLFLGRGGIENPRLNAERLLASVLKLDRVGLYLQFDKPLSPAERESFKALLKRRATHEPLQYIIGETEFMSLPFAVTRDVLIPRPETEILVEKVLESSKTRGAVRILDIGTGSGCIAVSLAKMLPESSIDAADVAQSALQLAKFNAERNGAADRMRFIEADVRAENFSDFVHPPYDAVVSNPPYVSLAEWPNLPKDVRDFEPRAALCDEKDGLAFYRVIAPKVASLLSPGGKLFVEIGFGQKDPVFDILRSAGFSGVEAYPDLNGIDRVVKGEFSNVNSATSPGFPSRCAGLGNKLARD
jgi:release factor glutamine methyltransferase